MMASAIGGRQQETRDLTAESCNAVSVVCKMKEAVALMNKKPESSSWETTFMQRQMRDELRQRLADFNFSHFVTLATNHGQFTVYQMRRFLKEWDARVNRWINGPKWSQRQDERLLWFAFPEKFEVNPHWHLLVQVDPDIDSPGRAARTDRLHEIGACEWLRLVPRGSFDCKDVASTQLIWYVTKALGEENNLETFICSREFIVN